MIEGISHITLIVEDLERTKKFLEVLFDAKEVYSSDGNEYSISKEKFFLIGDLWIAIMEGRQIDRSYNHIAFKIEEEDVEKYRMSIKRLGLEINEGRTRVEGEGQSIYFYDYDNHLFELHTGTLKERLKRYNIRKD